ncbi:beta-ketoacyl reductase, partial [Streptomyces sp. I05A-00742]|uniref:type I polyketide synthase n=1 Tax=Streptomyces sp. I05A-00742 TaxID=2732853 RepID=UPI00148833F1
HTLGAHTVTITACDTTNKTALTHTLNTIPTNHPLTAVIHTTGVLDDSTLTELTPKQLRTVLASKVDSAVNLHELTKDLDLGAFVLFSSVAGLLGSPGQANYSAANAFLDALAAHRQAHGLPATSLAWGLWAQASGMTGHLSDQDLARMSRSVIVPLESEKGLQIFDAANQAHRPLYLASLLNLEHIPQLPVWSRLATVRRTATAEQAGGPALSDQLAGIAPAERHEHVLHLVRAQIAVILTLDSPDAVEPNRGFLDQGLDSLTAVELRNRLFSITGIRLPATTVFDHPTPTALAQFILDQLAPADSESTETSADGGEAGEAEIRRALARVPLEHLRKAGLMTSLLQAIGLTAPAGAAETDGGSTEESIDQMDIEDLVQFAFGDES